MATGVPVAAFALFAIAGAGLSGCGFHPLYGSGPRAAQRNLSLVSVDTIADRAGQELRNKLLQSMNPEGSPERPAYTLQVSLKETKVRLGLQKDETATRASLQMAAQFRLVDEETGKTVMSGTSRAVSNYDVVISDFGTVIAEDDAREKAISAVGQDITYRVALFVDRRRKEAGENLNRTQSK